MKRVLDQIDINACEEIIENCVFYCKKTVRQRYYRGDGSYGYAIDKYEFLIIAENSIKKGIILKCGEEDLHWFVYRKWRNMSVLSNTLRTGAIHRVWPQNKMISCCYEYNDNYEEKLAMTKHLADIAGLSLRDEK